MKERTVTLIVVFLHLLVPSLGYSGAVGEGLPSLSPLMGDSPVSYNVTFVESGLPHGTYWGISINSSEYLSQTGEIFARLPNGGYNYTVSVQNSSFRPAYPYGALSVSGHPLTVAVQFMSVTYPVAFDEKGLPLGSVWTVDVGNVSKNATVQKDSGNYITFNLTNGTYSWNILPSGVYTSVPGNGSFKVLGNFTLVNILFEQSYSQVIFEEFNLPLNGSWSVDLEFRKNEDERFHPNAAHSSLLKHFSRIYVGTDSTILSGYGMFILSSIILAL